MNKYEGFGVLNALYENKNIIFDVKGRKKRNMNAYEKLVLGYLIKCYNEGENILPSYNKIARCCSVGRNTAHASIDNLEHSGYIVKNIISDNREDETQSKGYNYAYEIVWGKLEE